MTISWPPALPQAPKVNGFQKQNNNNKVSTPTAQGLQRRRRRFTGKVTKYLVSLPPMTAEQLSLFEEFYDDILFGGVDEFSWRDFSTYPIESAVFTFDDVEPTISAVTGPSATEQSRWNVSFTLIRRQS